MKRRAGRDEPPAGFSRYWAAYGGWKALLSSKYLWTAWLCTILTAPIWVRDGWWEGPLAVLPNLLGFTLGGYALLVSFGDEQFKAFLIDVDDVDGTTAFMSVSATFLHFILVQASALLVAVLAKSFFILPLEWLMTLGIGMGEPRTHTLNVALQLVIHCWWFFGFFLFLYSVLLIVAVGMAVFEVSGWFNDHRVKEAAREEAKASDERAAETGSSVPGAKAQTRDDAALT